MNVPPAAQLTGMTLPDGWRVVEMLPLTPAGTGGNFSVGYKVARDGQHAFLKALDYSAALQSPDPARTLQAMTQAYNFERDVLEKCNHKNLDRVVKALADGSVVITTQLGPQVVQYLIFELADGDTRWFLAKQEKLDIAWLLRSLHHIATGLTQLHGQNVAHQDVKPSNVLVFARETSKVGNVGRAAYKGHTPPHENFEVAGDPSYAPPELRYGYIDSDWNVRRMGCDAYLLGSMVLFFFMEVNTTAAILSYMLASHHPKVWKGTYEEVLPYVRDAFNRVILDFEAHIIPTLRAPLVPIVRQLCTLE